MGVLAANTLVVLLPVIGTVLGGLVAGGGVALWLARSNKGKLDAETEKIAAETKKVAEEAKNLAINSVTLALDRQDKTIARQDKTIADLSNEISEQTKAHVAALAELGERIDALEEALRAAHIALQESGIDLLNGPSK